MTRVSVEEVLTGHTNRVNILLHENETTDFHSKYEVRHFNVDVFWCCFHGSATCGYPGL